MKGEILFWERTIMKERGFNYARIRTWERDRIRNIDSAVHVAGPELPKSGPAHCGQKHGRSSTRKSAIVRHSRARSKSPSFSSADSSPDSSSSSSEPITIGSVATPAVTGVAIADEAGRNVLWAVWDVKLAVLSSCTFRGRPSNCLPCNWRTASSASDWRMKWTSLRVLIFSNNILN